MKRLQYSNCIFLLLLISIITFSCNKEEIELPENTIEFIRDGEAISITESKTTGSSFPNELYIRGTLIDNNIHIEVRFKGERLLLNITDTTEQVYLMDNQATSLKHFNTTDCNAYSNKTGTGTIEIIEWDTKNNTCKGRFRSQTVGSTSDGTVDGSEFVSGEFNIIIFPNRRQILDQSIQFVLNNQEYEVGFWAYNSSDFVTLDVLTFDDNIKNFNILFPKQTDEGAQEDNTKIEFNFFYNFQRFQNISPESGKTYVSINNTSLGYFALEIEDMVVTDVDNPENKLTINSVCLKVPYDL